MPFYRIRFRELAGVGRNNRGAEKGWNEASPYHTLLFLEWLHRHCPFL